VVQEGERDFVFEHNGDFGLAPHYVAEHAHEHADYRAVQYPAVASNAVEPGDTRLRRPIAATALVAAGGFR
jgi:hypothetical protein